MKQNPMRHSTDYLMEHDQETTRLEIKTNINVVAQQAQWAGIKAGMRVADIGCGPGKTSRVLFDLAQEGGEVVGIDYVHQRVAYAKEHYQVPGMQFEHRDARESLKDLGQFDFIWARFLLEYHGSKAYQIVENLFEIIKPGGILCLIDLDYNCMNHYDVPESLIQALDKVVERRQKYSDFDPYVGRKLYSFAYDIGCQEIDVMMSAHHLIFGKLNDIDEFNWTKKVEVGVKHSGLDLGKIYPGGYEGFLKDFKRWFSDPRRFTYTPLIATRGIKPA